MVKPCQVKRESWCPKEISEGHLRCQSHLPVFTPCFDLAAYKGFEQTNLRI